MIYFTDKGADGKILAKNSPAYLTALSELSDRSIERRIKVMGDDIIRIEDLPLKSEYLDQIRNKGIKIENELKWFNAVSAYLTASQIDILKTLSFIKNIEPVRTLRYRKPVIERSLYKMNQDSAAYGESYTQLRLSDIPVVHKRGITGKGVLLGVLDTGFRWRAHESLSNTTVAAEYDFIFDDSVTANEIEDASSQDFHGTTVLSIIAGYKDSVMIGAAYDAEFILAKTEDVRSETRVEEDNYAAALIWMESFGADITTNSLGYSEFDGFSYSYEDMNGKTTIVTKAAELAFERGILTISSAGNEAQRPWFYITAPADGINTLAIGAVDNRNRVAGFSSRGPSSDGRIKPDITAMGVSVFGASAVQSDLYGKSSGTSLASPLAAGSAALLLSAHPHLTNIQMRDIIIRTADNYSSPNNESGYGLISAQKSIEYPNLELQGGSYILHKTFLADDVSGANIYFSKDGRLFIQNTLTGDSIRFRYNVPSLTNGQVLYFYYEYTTVGGDTIRYPERDFYTLSYGDMLIKKIALPDIDFILGNNYPNPFNSTTRINFIAPQSGNAELIIYDALGQKVRTLFTGAVEQGVFTVEWNGRGDDGTYAASGIYIYRLKLNDTEVSKKMLLLK